MCAVAHALQDQALLVAEHVDIDALCMTDAQVQAAWAAIDVTLCLKVCGGGGVGATRIMCL
jgi:hypothetical protein